MKTLMAAVTLPPKRQAGQVPSSPRILEPTLLSPAQLFRFRVFLFCDFAALIARVEEEESAAVVEGARL